MPLPGATAPCTPHAVVNLARSQLKVIPQRGLPRLSPQFSSPKSAEPAPAEPAVHTDSAGKNPKIDDFFTVFWVMGTQLKPSTSEGWRTVICFF